MKTVLVIDDEPIVLRIAQLTLEASGFRVLQALDAARACAMFQEACGEIDLLLCDVTMPGVSVPAMAKAFRAVKPSLEVLLMSGRVEEAEVEQSGGARFNFLAKPFLPSVLARRVEEILAPVEIG
jgi:DNA-binding NtrC family response regulator